MVKNDSHFDLDKPYTFRVMFIITLTDLLWRESFIFHSEQATDTTTYKVLYAALFSASAVKNRLLDAEFIYTFTRFGLLLSDSEALEDDKKKFAAIIAGACLQLITADNVFMEKHFAKDALIIVLEALRVKRSILYPRGLELLEVGLFNLSCSLTNFHTRKP